MGAKITRAAALLLCLPGVAGIAHADASAAAAERVSYVEFVRCDAGVCEPQRKSVPVVEVLRGREAGQFCYEYTRRLSGFMTYPSLDPAVQIQVPQFEQTPRRFVRCEGASPLAQFR